MKIRLLLLPVCFLLAATACSLFPTVRPTPTAAPPAAQSPTVSGPTTPPVPSPAASGPTTPPAPSPAAAIATARPSAFEKAACPFPMPKGVAEGKDVECGYLVVPEDRSDPASRSLRLAVATFRNSVATTKPDPIVYLEGGPGGSALEFIDRSYGDRIVPYLAAGRDIILFDQRGVGLSEPALDCPAAVELDLDLMDLQVNGKTLTREEADALSLKATLDCGNDLAQTAKLSAYNSVESAADVEDLRKALGYDQVNLWGVSYGTRLALQVMRDYPAGVRSVVLDSVFPPDVNLDVEWPANAMRAFNVLFNACQADAACNAAYPDLKTVFFDMVSALNRQPAKIKVTNFLNEKSYDALLDGDTLLSVFFQMFYQTDMLKLLPQILYQVKAGDYNSVVSFMGVILASDESMSPGMHYSVTCNEERSFETKQQVEAELAKYPELQAFYGPGIHLDFDLCAGWDAGKAAAIENQPVSSAVPTLLMSGEYDPITPPAWARHAAQSLANSYFFEYPGMGHGVSFDDDCPINMMLDFVRDPGAMPSSACLGKMHGVAFALPLKVEDIVLQPFSNQLYRISGVVPEGWEEVQDALYIRGQSSMDPTMLGYIVVANAAPRSLAANVLNSLGIDRLPDNSESLKSLYMTWQIYRLDKAVINGQVTGVAVAAAQAGGKAYVVFMLTQPSDLDVLNTAVFIPALRALKPL